VIKASAAPCAREIYQTAAYAKRTISASRVCVIATCARILRGRSASILAKPASQFRLLNNEHQSTIIDATSNVADTFASTASAGPANPTRNARIGWAEGSASTTLDCPGKVAGDSDRLVPIHPIETLPFCPRILPSRRSARSVHQIPLAHPVRTQAPVPTRPPAPLRRDSAQATRIAPRGSVIRATAVPCAGDIY
jgi:hypothetical protein